MKLDKAPYVSVREDGSCWSDEVICCPYCQHNQKDISEIPEAYSEIDKVVSCGEYGKLFGLSTYIRYSWTTRKHMEEK